MKCGQPSCNLMGKPNPTQKLTLMMIQWWH
jgi:hypothetical protein